VGGGEAVVYIQRAIGKRRYRKEEGGMRNEKEGRRGVIRGRKNKHIRVYTNEEARQEKQR